MSMESSKMDIRTAVLLLDNCTKFLLDLNKAIQNFADLKSRKKCIIINMYYNLYEIILIHNINYK